jgi:hypothetical protein
MTAPHVRVFYPSRAPAEVALLASKAEKQLARDLEQLPAEALERMWRAHLVEQAFARFLANVKARIGLTR